MPSPDPERWNNRYESDDYLFGVQPSAFVVMASQYLPDNARVLCVGDGEGRNGAWLAKRGHHVTAFDVSSRADRKARALDTRLGASVDRSVASLGDWDFGVDRWDAVVASMVQFAPPDLRDWMFQRIRECVVPGGVALVHGYTPRQVGYGTGGPPNAENMYTAGMLGEIFADWEILLLREYEDDLVEGTGHVGRSALIDCIARRPRSEGTG